ncbi:MAG: DEAD/DEAH box helicase [Ruminococcus sp.]|jgi:type III restriction enzyme
MQIRLAEFQKEAVRRLMDAMRSAKRDIVLKSCTGSGKTIILTRFMDEYCREYERTVFVWLTPGRGNLEEQSKAKMDRYVHGSRTKLLTDVLAEGFEENDACFINWEKLTKKGNNALKEGEHTNFLEHIQHALDEGLTFRIIVDESHQNDTIKAEDIISYFHADKIIRCSATPRNVKNALLIEIPEAEVIAEGLIKKVLIINEDFAQNISVDSQVSYLLEKAVSKQQSLRAAFLKKGKDINPLIIIQIPNKSVNLQGEVEGFLETRGLTYENGRLAVWLSDRKENLEGIEEADGRQDAVIIKQAVATGWDCPRAYILVKLRDNMNETFEIQTIGRIRRMPEAVHYENDLLDSCYLYTLDEKFTEGVRNHLGKNALDALTLHLKPEHKWITLKSEQKTAVPVTRDDVTALQSIYAWFEKEYGIDSRTMENQKRLEAFGYIFTDSIRNYTISGRVATLDEVLEAGKKGLNIITIDEPLDTHKHGRAYHHTVAELGRRVSLSYRQMNTILRSLFDGSVRGRKKILMLTTREVYGFVLNNERRLKNAIRHAMADMLDQEIMKVNAKTLVDFTIPETCIFTYDSKAKKQKEMKKNVYRGYLASAEIRSSSEKELEKFCEDKNEIQWFYKNGDQGAEYFAIVYEDNGRNQHSFYPDYLVGIGGKIWILETKGGFKRNGKSEDIDIFSGKKFGVLKKYLQDHGLQGGFVRLDEKSRQLCICMDKYSDDIESSHWRLLEEVVEEAYAETSESES